MDEKKAPQRGIVEVDPDLPEAILSRVDQLAMIEVPRVRQLWELVTALYQHLGFVACGDGSEPFSLTIDRKGPPVRRLTESSPSFLLRRAAQLAAAASAASDPNLSDVMLGAVMTKLEGRTLWVPHERGRIDPFDFWRGLTAALISGDRGALQVLSRASDWVEFDPAVATQGPDETALYRSAFRAILAKILDSADADNLWAEANKLSARTLGRLDDFRQLRFSKLIWPVALGLFESSAGPACVDALTAHHEYYAEPHRRQDTLGLVAWGPLALATFRAVRLESDYLPGDLRESKAPSATELVYHPPALLGRTLAEAKLRLTHSFRGAVKIDGSPTQGRVTLSIAAPVAVHATFGLDDPSDPGPGLARAPSTLLDPVELMEAAEARRGSPDPDERALGRSCVEAAFLALGEEDEEFDRTVMTSPHGRQICDAHPDRVTRVAIELLRLGYPQS